MHYTPTEYKQESIPGLRQTVGKFYVHKFARISAWSEDDQGWAGVLLRRAKADSLADLNGLKTEALAPEDATALDRLLRAYGCGQLLHAVHPRSRVAHGHSIDSSSVGAFAKESLARAGVHCWEDAAQLRRADLKHILGLDPERLTDIERGLEQVGLSLEIEGPPAGDTFPLALLLPVGQAGIPHKLVVRLLDAGASTLFDVIAWSVLFLRERVGLDTVEIDALRESLTRFDVVLASTHYQWLAASIAEISRLFAAEVSSLSTSLQPPESKALWLEEELDALVPSELPVRVRGMAGHLLGWTGALPRTARETAEAFGVSVGRVQDFINCLGCAAHSGPLVFVDAIARYLAEAGPIVADEAEDELLESGLMQGRWYAESLRATLVALGRPVEWRIWTFRSQRIIATGPAWAGVQRCIGVLLGTRHIGGLLDEQAVAAVAESNEREARLARAVLDNSAPVPGPPSEPTAAEEPEGEQPEGENTAVAEDGFEPATPPSPIGSKLTELEALPLRLLKRIRATARRQRGPWSLVEAGFTETELEEFREFASTATTRRQINEAYAAMFLACSAAIAQQLAHSGELWPPVRQAFSDSLRRLFFGAGGQPTPQLREELHNLCERYRLRHALGNEGQQIWVRTVFLQFGLSQQGLYRLAHWLDQPTLMPVALDELTRQSTTFKEFWQNLQRLRRGRGPVEEVRASVAASPWIAGLSAEAVLRAAQAIAEPEEEVDERPQPAVSIFDAPRLRWADGQPMFELPLVSASAFLKEERYSIVLPGGERILVRRGEDGLEAERRLLLEAKQPVVEVRVEHNRKNVLPEPFMKIRLTPESEPYALFSLTTGTALPVNQSIAAGKKVAILLPEGWTLSQPGDFDARVFSTWTLIAFRTTGIPVSLSIRDSSGTVAWINGEEDRTADEIHRTVGLLSVRGQGGRWGDSTPVFLEGLPDGFTPRLILTESESAPCSPIPDGRYETRLRVTPQLDGQRVQVECERSGRLHWLRAVLKLKESYGAAIQSSEGWLTLTPHMDVDAEYLKNHDVWAVPPQVSNDNRTTRDWAWLEGCEKRCQLNGKPQRLSDPDGIGSGLFLALGPFNHVREREQVARAVIDTGEIGYVDDEGDPLMIHLRQPLTLGDEHSLWIWRAGEARPHVLDREDWTQTEPTLIEVRAGADGLLGVALSYERAWLGARTGARGWGGFAALCRETPDWPATAAWMAWWRVPVLHPILREQVRDTLRSHPVETFLAWLTPPRRYQHEAKYDPHHVTRWSSAMIELFEGIALTQDQSADLLSALKGTSRVPAACAASPLFVLRAIATLAETGDLPYYAELLTRDKPLEQLQEHARQQLEVDPKFINSGLLPDMQKRLNGLTPELWMNLQVAMASSRWASHYLAAATLNAWMKKGSIECQIPQSYSSTR